MNASTLDKLLGAARHMADTFVPGSRPALGSRRWQYDLVVRRGPGLEGLKQDIVRAVRNVRECCPNQRQKL
jgi:hypothetical protein